MIPSDFCPLCGNELLLIDATTDPAVDGWVFECVEGHRSVITDHGLEVFIPFLEEIR